MAKKYHPLDVRYKGPSTAFTGKARAVKIGTPDPAAAIARDAKPPLPTRAMAEAGPWQNLHPREDIGPPPLPTDAAKPRSRRSVMRVMIGITILAVIVGGNILATRQYDLFLFDLQSEMNAFDR